ncbi:hypothetical protein K443DRAFT_12727 [Laccaria amethystina LaAM-08-1]|uniref:Uncharacterized protein n=1 Tax=Laccaria amethystina LaAM-08-1 TaxID=1095629 RepID=A0A0C9WXL4_9AGAR|nr:hypothetical protein K443DRAFT_12727 [Laccaria amethystina LaAM-08-1]
MFPEPHLSLYTFTQRNETTSRRYPGIMTHACEHAADFLAFDEFNKDDFRELLLASPFEADDESDSKARLRTAMTPVHGEKRGYTCALKVTWKIDADGLSPRVV